MSLSTINSNDIFNEIVNELFGENNTENNTGITENNNDKIIEYTTISSFVAIDKLVYNTGILNYVRISNPVCDTCGINYRYNGFNKDCIKCKDEFAKDYRKCESCPIEMEKHLLDKHNGKCNRCHIRTTTHRKCDTCFEEYENRLLDRRDGKCRKCYNRVKVECESCSKLYRKVTLNKNGGVCKLCYNENEKRINESIENEKNKKRKIDVLRPVKIDLIKQNSCAICLCDWEEDDDINILKCHHYFHAKCVNELLKKHKDCPICRESIL